MFECIAKGDASEAIAPARAARYALAKILLVLVVFGVVYLVVRTYARGITKRQNASIRQDVTEDMVQCSHCGVHLPRSDCTTSGERYFCSKEHQRLHGR